MKKKIGILLADDHPVFLEGLVRAISVEEDLECLAKATDGEEAVTLAEKTRPDVIIMDISMPNRNGIQAAGMIKSVLPNTAIIILSAYKSRQYVDACLEVGVEGYILKDTPREELLNIVRIIHSGKSVYNVGISKRFSDMVKADMQTVEKSSNELNARELQVLKLACTGMSNKEISHELGISVHTVETYFVNVFRKLQVRSRLEAAMAALKEGLIAVDIIE